MLWPNLFAIALWPLIGLGIWLMAKGAMGGHSKLAVCLILVACCALIIGPIFVIEVVWRHYTAATVAADDSLFAAYGLLMVVRDPRARPTPNMTYRIKSIVVALLGAGVAIWSLWFLVGDFVVPQKSIDGIVAGFAYEPTVPGCRRRCVYDYYLKVDGHRYLTTYEIFDRFWVSKRLQGTVGRASDRILSADGASP